LASLAGGVIPPAPGGGGSEWFRRARIVVIVSQAARWRLAQLSWVRVYPYRLFAWGSVAGCCFACGLFVVALFGERLKVCRRVIVAGFDVVDVGGDPGAPGVVGGCLALVVGLFEDAAPDVGPVFRESACSVACLPCHGLTSPSVGRGCCEWQVLRVPCGDCALLLHTDGCGTVPPRVGRVWVPPPACLPWRVWCCCAFLRALPGGAPCTPYVVSPAPEHGGVEYLSPCRWGRGWWSRRGSNSAPCCSAC